MAIEVIAKQIWEDKSGVLDVTSERSDALDDFEVSLRSLSPHIVVARGGLKRSDPHKLKAKLTVADDSFEWVREQLLRTLSNDALTIKLEPNEPA